MRKSLALNEMPKRCTTQNKLKENPKTQTDLNISENKRDSRSQQRCVEGSGNRQIRGIKAMLALGKRNSAKKEHGVLFDGKRIDKDTSIAPSSKQRAKIMRGRTELGLLKDPLAQRQVPNEASETFEHHNSQHTLNAN